MRPRSCRLALVAKGKVFDEEMACMKIDEDVDLVMKLLLCELGYESPSEYSPLNDPLMAEATCELADETSAPWRVHTRPPQSL